MDGTKKRGRPPKPTGHPVGSRMRQRREALGLTVRELTGRVALRATSGSYLSQLESGAKTPHPELARRLAAALDDDPRIYLAWAATGRRADPVATAAAVHTLAETLRHPRYFIAEAPTSGEPARPAAWSVPPAPIGATAGASASPGSPTLEAERLPGATSHPLPSPPPRIDPRAGEATDARLLVPEIAEGDDPGPPQSTPARERSRHRVAAGALAGVEPPVRPFAFRLSETSAHRVGGGLGAGDLVILSRRAWPLEPFTPCAVRLSGHVSFARAAWNGRQLVVLLPGGDGGDFIVLDTPDRATLEQRVAGRAVAVVRAAALAEAEA
jgi:transcriptional regulator with XRE-family HTH domain